MRFLTKALLLSLITYAQSVFGLYDSNSPVVSLTQDNFDQFIQSHDITLVEYYAPWCGHCKNLAPKYDVAARELKDIAPLAAVDCTTEKDLCSKYGIRGFPTLKVVSKDGKTTDYQGGRESKDIVTFMKRQMQPAYVFINANEVSSKVANEPIAVVGYFKSADNENAKTFIQSANSLRNDYAFFVVVDDSITDERVDVHKLEGKKQVSSSTSSEEDMSSTTGIKNYIVSESFPLVGQIGPENYQKYIDRGYPLVWMFVDYDDDNTDDLLTMATDIAKNHKGKLSFVHLDGIKWAEHSKHFGLSGTKLPGIVIEDRKTNRNYAMSENDVINHQSFSQHVSSYVDGTLAPTVKSEEIPASQDGPVYVVVGKTFDEVVMDNERDVFVEFYAPWCGHCKSLAPKYDALGDMFKNNPHVRIAKIDATANDVSAVDIQGFPTLYLFKANDKQNPIQYQGERTEQAMADFVRQHSSFPAAAAAAAEFDDDDSHDEL